MDILSLIGRSNILFKEDLEIYNEKLITEISKSRFLIIGGAGSIGQAVTNEIFRRNPRALHVVDISENNIVELVRLLRSTVGYIDGDFKTFALDSGSNEFDALMTKNGPFDYIFNLSALKHVRSEKDPFTIMRMINVNIFNAIKLARIAKQMGAKKYFCVSTDKASNPVNMMGASKRIMEMFLMRESEAQPLSMARFANVAFSDGSLLDGFNKRFAKQQPIAAPFDVRRYFLTPQESGELCLLSAILGKNRDIYFPKLDQERHMITFSEIAVRYLNSLGFKAYECSSEHEARETSQKLIEKKLWPCYFFKSDTTGEKDFEEFFTGNENVDMSSFEDVGVIKSDPTYREDLLNKFTEEITRLQLEKAWNKADILKLFHTLIPDFQHKEKGKYLDERM